MGATYTPVTSGIYSVVVSNAQSCTDSTSIQVTINPTGIDDPDNIIKVSVYPNPATDMVYIESATPLQALITDLSGRVLIEARHGKAFDISKLQSGAYFIKIMNDAGDLVTIRKFIKMKQ